MSRLSLHKAPEQKLQQDTTSSIERAHASKPSNLAQNLLALQRLAGNQAVTHVLQRAQHTSSPGAPLSEVPMLPENSPYRSPTLQIRHHLRNSSLPSATIQRKGPYEEEMLKEGDGPSTQRKENHTGLPDALKAGVEQLSGLSMDDVRVHYNSPKPAEVQALAYTQGTNIHIGPGQEQHLPHEAWHVVQQMQRRVRPTMQDKGIAINDDQELERKADDIGKKVASSGKNQNSVSSDVISERTASASVGNVIQRAKKRTRESDDIEEEELEEAEDVYSGPSPADAVEPINYFKNTKGTWMASDGNQERWYLRNDGEWQKTGKKKIPTYGRFKATQQGRGGFRRASKKGREGSASSYKETATRSQAILKTAGGIVKRRNRSKRKQAQVMKQVTGQISATKYAANVGAIKLDNGYEWCHLVGRGAGGKDTPENLVAASKHANTEMKTMEDVYYGFTQDDFPGQVSIHWEAKLWKDTQVATLLIGTVSINGEEIYKREIHGQRKQPVSKAEKQAVQDELTEAITAAPRKRRK
jgi:hypothetical protein